MTPPPSASCWPKARRLCRNPGQAVSAAAVLAAVTVVLLVASETDGFNVDVSSKVVHSGPRRSCDQECMFGFSVAQHRDKGTPWLLVGAPEADAGQRGVVRGGAVYKCRPDSPGQCDLIQFDKEGNTVQESTGQQYDNKTGQWFGSLVTSSGEDGVVLACAPRYVWYSRNYKRREPIGTCFTAKNEFSQISEYSPCKTRKWGYHRQGSCQAGLGAAIADDGDQVFVGAVGSWYWQGQVFSRKLNSLRDHYKTAEGSPDDDDSYLGYSVTTGDFNGDGESVDAAVGMPRGHGLRGQVIIYDSSLTNLYNITGNQIGAYFGYSIAAGDFNGDGLDDLVIGAPMYADFEEMSTYETGRVYVLFQGQDNSFVRSVVSDGSDGGGGGGGMAVIDGKNHKARFGLAVACIGNLNLDGRSQSLPKGIEDIAVGAPYDGPDHRGAVYIYLGSETRSSSGEKWDFAQVIFARDLSVSGLRTFGWSLSGGMDLDGNEYPDLLVGAYESAKAVYLKSSPVVHLKSEVIILAPNKQIELDEKRCQLRDGTRVSCVEVEVKMNYHGVGVPDSIDLELQYVLDSKKDMKTRRLFMVDHEGLNTVNKSVTVMKNRPWSHRFKAYLPSSTIHDKLTAIDVEVRYSMVTSRGQFSRPGFLKPVLGQKNLVAKDTVVIAKACASDDGRCVPNLSIDAEIVAGSYSVGAGEKMEIIAKVDNEGEEAFNARLYVQIPPGVQYINAKSSSAAVPVLCSEPNASNNQTLTCNIGNPLPANTQLEVVINLQPTEKAQDERLEGYHFYMAVNSSNLEEADNVENNQRHLFVPISVTTDCRVTGTSKPAFVEYNMSAPIPKEYFVEDQLGEEVIHVYDLKNKGPATIQEAEVFILWPSFGDYKEHLLYLLGVDYDRSKVTCQPIKNINPDYVQTYGSAGYAAALAQAQESEEFLTLFGRSSGSSSSGATFSSKSVTYGRTQGSSYSTSASSASSSSGGTYGSGTFYESSGSSWSGSSSSGITRGGGGGGSSGAPITNGRNSYSYERETIYNSGTSSSNGGGGSGNGRRFNVNEEKQTSSSSGGIGSGGNGRNSYEYESRRTSTSSSSSSSSSGSSGAGGSGSGRTFGWKLLENGTYIRTYDSKTTANGGSNKWSSASSASSSGGGGNRLSESEERRKNTNTIFNAAQGPGDYHGTISKDELERQAGGKIFSSTSTETRNQVENTRYQGGSYTARGSSSNSNRNGNGAASSSSKYGGSYSSTDSGYNRATIGGGSTTFEEGSYFDSTDRRRYQDSLDAGKTRETASSGNSLFESGYRVESDGSSTSYSSSGSSSSNGGSSTGGGSSSSKGTWVWSDVTNKWEWSESSTSSAASSNSQGSSTVSGSAAGGGSSNNYDSGHSDTGWVMLPNGTRTRSYSSWSSSSSSSTSGGRSGGGGGGASGWVRGEDGTWVRSGRQGSRRRGEGAYGGVEIGSQDALDLESGDHGSNSTGWVEQPDGTMIRKSSSWASWSKTSSSQDDLDLDKVQKDLETRARQALTDQIPPNVEPGFENEFRENRRYRRATNREFLEEIQCDPDKCTLIRCSVGPLLKDESVIFTIRSRLFTQGQIENYNHRVDISSKLVTRITRLPYLTDPSNAEIQMIDVTTQVYPSNMGEAPVPWWVLLLAVLGGLLLLGVFVYGLYKCGFFKRQRPDESPESEPLNHNGY